MWQYFIKPKEKCTKKKPTAAGITLAKPSPELISIAGESKLQKLAATITPPVKPSIPSSKPLFIFLKKDQGGPKSSYQPGECGCI